MLIKFVKSSRGANAPEITPAPVKPVPDVSAGESTPGIHLAPPASFSKAHVTPVPDDELLAAKHVHKPADMRVARLPKRLLSVKETAAYLGKSEKTILRMIKSGDLQAYQVGRHWKIAPEAIEILLATCANWRRVNVS
jgi:excisionase family DNA binding protein